MKYFIAVVALAALAAARPQNPQQDQVLRQSSDVAPDHYNYVYETSNGITANEQGQLKAAQNEEGSAIAAQGSYQYTAPDGTPIQVSYIADENGFQPQGAHIPVAPGIPEHIQRALEYIRTHPQQQQ